MRDAKRTYHRAPPKAHWHKESSGSHPPLAEASFLVARPLGKASEGDGRVRVD